MMFFCPAVDEECMEYYGGVRCKSCEFYDPSIFREV